MCLKLVFLVFFSINVSCDDVFTNRFCDIRFKATFIDKTLLIHKVFKQQHLCVSAPYLFGKSANIGMLNMFLSNLRTKETIEEYFRDTEIWKDEVFVREHMGEYPVILYNTSVHQVVYDETHMKVSFKWTLHNTFLDHAYLLDNQNITSEDMELLETYMDVQSVQTVDIDGIIGGLKFLARMLYQHHNKSVILLADGFGAGIMERLIYDNEDHRHLNAKVVEWYSAVIKNTLSDPMISHSVVSAETRLYGLNETVFKEVSFTGDKHISQFFGFTHTEVERLLERFDIPPEQKPVVLKWFCGYSTPDGSVEVCNPYSVIHFLRHPYNLIRVYWTGSPTGPDLVQRIIHKEIYRIRLRDLVLGKSISIVQNVNFNHQTVEMLRQTINELSAESESFIFQVLLEVGYVTYAGPSSSGTVSLKFPNEEVRSVIDKFVSLVSFI